MEKWSISHLSPPTYSSWVNMFRIFFLFACSRVSRLVQASLPGNCERNGVIYWEGGVTDYPWWRVMDGWMDAMQFMDVMGSADLGGLYRPDG